MITRLLCLLFLGAQCLSAPAQRTSEPPEVKHSPFHWTSQAPEHKASAFHWTCDPPQRADKDTCDFVKRAGLSSPADIVAVSGLVHDLKVAGLWKKLDVFYPFVGGNSGACAQNLVSRRFTITWSGGVGCDERGITGDGTCYGDSHYAPNMAADPNSFHVYGLVGGDTTYANNPTPLFGTTGCYLSFRRGAFTMFGPNCPDAFSLPDHGPNFLMQRTSATTRVFITDSLHQVVPSNFAPPAADTIKVLGALPANSTLSAGTLRVFSCGAAFTDADAAALFAAVNRFQAVLTPAE
jgi:hypothetical protein